MGMLFTWLDTGKLVDMMSLEFSVRAEKFAETFL
jgi:hypothetical protein